MDSESLFLAGNTDTVYAWPMLDLKKDGPTVVEIPAGCGPGTVNDDGSYTLCFGPKAPVGKEANWIQTVKGMGWFRVLRR